MNRTQKEQNLRDAAENGDIAATKKLITEGTDVNAADSNGFTPLMVAVQEGHSEVVNILLDLGAVFDVVNKDGFTALTLAAGYGHSEVVSILLNKGAFIEAANKNGYTPLIAAAWSGHSEVVSILLDKGAFIEASYANGFTALIAAAQEGHAEVVTILLEKGAFIEAANKDGVTSLHRAAYGGHRAVVQLLLAGGASVDAKDMKGNTPVMVAQEKGHRDVVALLERALQAAIGSTPLHHAAMLGQTVTAQLLLDGGANINATDKDGNTPLHLAASEGKLEVVSLLLVRGARPDLANKAGRTSVKRAQENGHRDVAATLKIALQALPKALSSSAAIPVVNSAPAAPIPKMVTAGVAEVSSTTTKIAVDNHVSSSKTSTVESMIASELQTKHSSYDIHQLREMIQSTAAHVSSLSHMVHAHDVVLDIMVTKTKECPSLVMLIPCKKAWKNCISPTTFTQDKFMLTFICPVSLCVVECGPKGLGWEVAEPKKWVKKWGPALLVTLKVLQVAAVAGRVLGLPIPCLPTADNLGLGLDTDSKLISNFMTSSWSHITFIVEAGLDGASSVLSKSSIPSLEAATPSHALLKCSDEAYKAVHSFVRQFGAIEDLLRGKMSREMYGPHVEWVSTGMIDIWKEQLKFKEQESAKALVAPPIPVISATFYDDFQLPPIPPDTSFQASTSAEFPWLAYELSKFAKLSHVDIVNVIRALVNDGINDKEVMSGISTDKFTDKYLDSIGITKLGEQQHLLRIHKELQGDKESDQVHQSSLKDVASAKKVRELESELQKMKTRLGSISSETDSDVVVGNQKLKAKNQQSMDHLSGKTTSQSTIFDMRLAQVESAVQVLSQHVSLQAEQEIAPNPQVVTKNEQEKMKLFFNK